MAQLRAQVARRGRRFKRYLSTEVDVVRLRQQLETVRAYVMFVGQPRTGHSLVGALLDAHPNALIAHELDALRYVESGYDRRRLFALLIRQAQARAAAGNESAGGYSYAVPGQWQGRFERLEVIGDKKGGSSTTRLTADIGLLDELSATIGMEPHVVNVVRNPYDVIASLQRLAPERAMGDLIDLYFDWADTVEEVRRRVEPTHFHRMHLEDLVGDPSGALTALCSFVDLPAADDYLDACSQIVFAEPVHRRKHVDWTPEFVDRVATLAEAHPASARYRFNEGAPGDESRPEGHIGEARPAGVSRDRR